MSGWHSERQNICLCVCVCGGGGGGGGDKEKFRASVGSFEEIHVCSYIRNTGKPMKATCQSSNLKLKVKDKTSLSWGGLVPSISYYLTCTGTGVKIFQSTVVVVLLFYVHGKHLRSCRDGQLT